MPDLGHRDRVLQALRISARPLDDDQLSERSGVRPRQQVNQICRALERAGLIRRYFGPDQKIVNELTVAKAAATDVLARPLGTDDPTINEDAAGLSATDDGLPPGSSREQRVAERIMLDLLSKQLNVALEPARIVLPSGARVEVDGADAARGVLVECWAHQGPPKAAQRHKVLSDAFKLVWISSTIYPRPKLILCLSDSQAAAPFQPQARSWAAQAFKDLGITICLVDLPGDTRRQLLAAQHRQYR